MQTMAQEAEFEWRFNEKNRNQSKKNPKMEKNPENKTKTAKEVQKRGKKSKVHQETTLEHQTKLYTN